LGQTSPDTSPGAATPARAVKRMEFSDAWLRRFCQLDGADVPCVDPSARALPAAIECHEHTRLPFCRVAGCARQFAIRDRSHLIGTNIETRRW
jgi:hypothetical protein